LIVKTRGKFRLPTRQFEVLELPCSWQTFSRACERLVNSEMPMTRRPMAIAGPARMTPATDAVLA
jgi:hypothetical protein